MENNHTAAQKKIEELDEVATANMSSSRSDALQRCVIPGLDRRCNRWCMYGPLLRAGVRAAYLASHNVERDANLQTWVSKDSAGEHADGHGDGQRRRGFTSDRQVLSLLMEGVNANCPVPMSSTTLPGASFWIASE